MNPYRLPFLLFLLFPLFPVSCAFPVVVVLASEKFDTFWEQNNNAEVRNESIRIRCAGEPDESECVANHEEGFKNFSNVYRAFRWRDQSVASSRLFQCVNEGQAKTPDWHMLADCVERHWEIWQELN